MANEKRIASKKLRLYSVVVCLFSAYFSYPYLIAGIAARNMPPGWSPELGRMTFKEIYSVIGPPQADMSAKDYQDWEVRHWWGVEILKIMSSDCCGPDSRASDIQYVVYVRGKDMPARREFIFEEAKGGWGQVRRTPRHTPNFREKVSSPMSDCRT